MLALQELREVRTIVGHDHCPDGLASAILLHDALPGAAIQFMQYGTAAHRDLVATPGMLFCDFSPHPNRVAEFARQKTIVLDHHATAQPIVEAMGERGIFADEKTQPGVCGAVLAYQHVWLPLRGASGCKTFAKDFADIAGVRDTWQRADARWRESCAQAQLLEFFPKERWLGRSLEAVATDWPAQLETIGYTLLAKYEARVAGAVEEAFRFETPTGHKVFVLDGLSTTGDAANLLASAADLVVGFHYGTDAGVPKVRFSLRSRTGFDCAALAASYGGGGHRAAAGFSLPVEPSDPQPFALIARLLRT